MKHYAHPLYRLGNDPMHRDMVNERRIRLESHPRPQDQAVKAKSLDSKAPGKLTSKRLMGGR